MTKWKAASTQMTLSKSQVLNFKSVAFISRNRQPGAIFPQLANCFLEMFIPVTFQLESYLVG